MQRTSTESGESETPAPSGDFLLPTYADRPLTLVRGEGTAVWDQEGRRYLDFTGGIAVNLLGHAHPALRSALQDQAGKLIHCSNLFYNEPANAFARALVERIGPGGIFFCNSGAEANEALFKFARKFGSATGRYEIITANNSFHGRTLAGISATGQAKVKEGFGPLLPGFTHVPFNDMEAIRDALTPKTVAVHIEGIQGEGGIIPADPGYLLELRQWTRENEVLLLWDGVQCGQFRTGHFQSYTTLLENVPGSDGFLPDGLAMAKSLGAGFPLGAAWIHEDYAHVLGPGSHGCTYGGNPLACAVGLAVLREVESGGWCEHARHVGKRLLDGLGPLKENGRCEDVRGAGVMIGITVREDLPAVRHRLMEAGLLVVPSANQTIRLLPPINVQDREVEEALQILKEHLSR